MKGSYAIMLPTEKGDLLKNNSIELKKYKCSYRSLLTELNSTTEITFYKHNAPTELFKSRRDDLFVIKLIY